MASFNNDLNNLVLELQTNAALKAFCASKWNKALTVKRVYKNRTEISKAELPVILLTRPSVSRKIGVISDGAIIDKTHRVRLYCGFLQSDLLKAQEELVEFEELIEDAVMTYSQASSHETIPSDSANDEGVNAPEYYLVSDFLIKEQRE